MNKYEKWYTQIIENSKARHKGEVYTERHHIVPSCLGGADTASNLTNLTAREHFICHWLLTKIYHAGEEHWKMLNAFRMMRAENPNQQRYETKITARVYENLKIEYSKLQSEKVSGENNPMYGKSHSAEAKAKISNANKGRIQSPEEKQRQVEAMTGRKRKPFSEEWKANLKKAHAGENNPMYGKAHSADTKRKISERMTGKKQDPEVVERRRQAQLNLNLKREKKLCPHCNQEISVNTYPRWHGENCQKNPSKTLT